MYNSMTDPCNAGTDLDQLQKLSVILLLYTAFALWDFCSKNCKCSIIENEFFVMLIFANTCYYTVVRTGDQ